LVKKIKGNIMSFRRKDSLINVYDLTKIQTEIAACQMDKARIESRLVELSTQLNELEGVK